MYIQTTTTHLKPVVVPVTAAVDKLGAGLGRRVVPVPERREVARGNGVVTHRTQNGNFLYDGRGTRSGTRSCTSAST